VARGEPVAGGDAFVFENWSPTEPNNIGLEKFAHFWGPTDPRAGQWNNRTDEEFGAVGFFNGIAEVSREVCGDGVDGDGDALPDPVDPDCAGIAVPLGGLALPLAIGLGITGVGRLLRRQHG